MYFDNKDRRIPLNENTVIKINDISTNSRREYVIDALAGSGGFSLMYIAHEKNNPHHYFALKELFPRALDDAIAERREDGKIVIYNPMTETEDCDNQGIWDQITPYFEREVKLTRKAATVYDSNGRIIAQNNPDVLGIYGPFIAENGNRYIAIDTKAGKSFQQFIDNGWESNSEKGVYRNNLLGEIIDVLVKVTQRLSALHGDRRMYHLDLSPANIYISYINGGVDVEPTIIDYGSAYDRDDPEDLTSHRFTCNPYSAPEVNALAELNDQTAGYYVDVTSDTYSVAAMLFYAVLGELYTVSKIYDISWREKIRRLYPEVVYNDFAEKLIAFFCRGLSADQSERYVTIQPSVNRKQLSLYDALADLKKAYKVADILNEIPDDELMSYLILDKYPLFRYFGKGKDIHVLCLGSGVFVNRMILSIVSTGQMVDRKLFIHVVSADADQYKQNLLAQAPMLKEYADFGDNEVVEENKYVTFTFEAVSDLKEENILQNIAEKYGKVCRYVVTSLGANNDNVTIAKCIASKIGNISRNQTIVNYYMSEDSATNTRVDVDEMSVPPRVKVIPFGKMLASYNKDVHILGMKAFRIHYLYEKLYDKKASKNRSLQKFISDKYSQRSSTAAAVHIDYKLASLGINTADPKKMKKSKHDIDEYQTDIIDNYNKLVFGYCEYESDSHGAKQKIENPHTKEYNKLLQLEHTRWMMFMIADGYRLTTPMDYEKYSFRQIGDNFNKAFKCTNPKIKTHHCLVPCGTEGITLPHNHNEWDKYTTIPEIEATSYDALDKTSLTVHLIAKERIERPETLGKIKSIVENELHEKLYLAPGEIGLKSEYENFRKWILQVLKHKKISNLNEKLKSLKTQFELYNIDINDIVTKLTNEFSIFVEFQKYNDYKKPDQAIIEHLLWAKFGVDVTMLKITTKSVLSNIASSLMIEPQKLVFLGKEQPQCLAEFFENHGNNTEVFFEQCNLNSTKNVADVLTHIIEQSPSENFVIDATEGTPFFITAAIKIAESNRNVGVIYCDPQDCYSIDDISITNIANYPYAPVHRLKTSISANEVFELYGASEKASEGSYMLGLSDYMDSLWEFYQNHSHEWEMISSFFEGFGRGSSEFHISDFSVADAKWSLYSRRVSFDICEKTGIFNVLHRLEDHGIIKGFACERTEAYTTISFMYPVTDPNNNSNLFSKKFSDLFNSLGDAELTCTIKSKSDNVFDIDILTGLKVFRNFKETGKFSNNDKQNPKEFLIVDMEAAFKELEDRRLISSLEFKPSTNGGCYISFTYNSSAIRDCLTTAGNILEAFVYHQADKTGYFDSLKANYSFSWANSNVSNELDVILTKGLTTLVCSCKTAKMAKEHLYEVAELARRFSVNTKPVIIYSSDKSVENGKIFVNTESVKERAKAMGIYLIDKDTLNCGLSAELVRIAKENDIGN